MANRKYRTFLNKIRTYDPDSLVRLCALAAALRITDPGKLSLETARFFKYPEGVFLDFILAGIVQATFEPAGRGSYRRDRNPGWRDLGRLQDLYISCPSDEPMESLDDLQKYFFRTAFLQFPTQHGSWKQLPRALLLHSETMEAPGFDVPSMFTSTMGLSLREFTIIGLSLFTLASISRSGLLDVSVINALGIPELSAERIQIFLGHTSASLSELSAEKAGVVSVPGYEIYDFNPLVARPIVRLSGGRLSLPVPALLIDRITEGIYYDLAEEHGSAFLDYLGRSFESYAGRLFLHLNDFDVRAEEEYGPKKKRKRSIDWLIGRGADALLLECKTKRLRRGSPTPARAVQLLDDLKKGVVRGVRQLADTTAAMEEGLVFTGYESAHIIPFVVTLDDSFLFNSDPVKSLVREHAGLHESDFTYQIASVAEIEDLAALATSVDIFALLKDKIESPERREYDLSTALRDLEFASHPLLLKSYQGFLETFRLSVDA